MASKLGIYNAALGELMRKRLASLAENREERRVLDDYYDAAVGFALERKLWNFSYRSISAEAEDAILPRFGYLFAFTIPVDWIRTRKLSASETFDPPLLQFAEEAGYWYANLTPIFVQYNSRDPQYGTDLGAWPESFVDYVVKRLARLACKRITNSDELLKGPTGLIKEEERAYKIAAANCAMNEAVGFAPMSSWVRARRGFGRMPGPGGDSPTGGGLIP